MWSARSKVPDSHLTHGRRVEGTPILLGSPVRGNALVVLPCPALGGFPGSVRPLGRAIGATDLHIILAIRPTRRQAEPAGPDRLASARPRFMTDKKGAADADALRSLAGALPQYRQRPRLPEPLQGVPGRDGRAPLHGTAIRGTQPATCRAGPASGTVGVVEPIGTDERGPGRPASASLAGAGGARTGSPE